MKFAQPKNANYYDLVRIPHGHIPAPMIKFWSWLPIPIRGQRDEYTFRCGTCGSPSFFKSFHCETCYDWYEDDPRSEKKWKELREKENIRAKWKNWEYRLLPLLVLIGKAWYMPSERLTYLEQVKKYGPPTQFEYDEEEDEELLNELTGEHCPICGKALTQEDEFGAPDHPQCCEEHGDFLNLCGRCWEIWMMQCQEPEGCIREWFKNRREQRIEATNSS
jgi:hypothetical protein